MKDIYMIKRLIAVFILIPIMFLFSGASVFAQIASVHTTHKIHNQNFDGLVPLKLEESMKTAIAHIYGKEQVDTIYPEIVKIIKRAKFQRAKDLYEDDLQRDSDWYKEEVVYMFYPDQFGVDETGKPATFKTLIGMLDYLKDLGVTTIYILPFADSPMGDSGFDVRDPKNVRKDLGGMEEFEEFMLAARQKGFKIKYEKPERITQSANASNQPS